MRAWTILPGAGRVYRSHVAGTYLADPACVDVAQAGLGDLCSNRNHLDGPTCWDVVFLAYVYCFRSMLVQWAPQHDFGPNPAR